MIDEPKPRRRQHQSRKNFGYPEDNWARLGGPNGKKMSYGHRATLDNRSKAEKINDAERNHEIPPRKTRVRAENQPRPVNPCTITKYDLPYHQTKYGLKIQDNQ